MSDIAGKMDSGKIGVLTITGVFFNVADVVLPNKLFTSAGIA